MRVAAATAAVATTAVALAAAVAAATAAVTAAVVMVAATAVATVAARAAARVATVVKGGGGGRAAHRRARRRVRGGGDGGVGGGVGGGGGNGGKTAEVEATLMSEAFTPRAEESVDVREALAKEAPTTACASAAVPCCVSVTVAAKPVTERVVPLTDGGASEALASSVRVTTSIGTLRRRRRPESAGGCALTEHVSATLAPPPKSISVLPPQIACEYAASC